MHRDSVGSEQPIRPGEVNWMIATAPSNCRCWTMEALAADSLPARPTGSSNVETLSPLFYLHWDMAA